MHTFHPAVGPDTFLLDPDQRRIAGAVLQDIAADLADLTLVVKQARWTVAGVDVGSVHFVLDELVAAAANAADAVAHRSAAMGVEWASHSALNPPAPGIAWTGVADVVPVIDRALSALIERLRARIDVLDDVDAATRDLAATIASRFQHLLRMLQV